MLPAIIFVVFLVIAFIFLMSNSSNSNSGKAGGKPINADMSSPCETPLPEASKEQLEEIGERCKARGITKWEDNPSIITGIVQSVLHKNNMPLEDAEYVYKQSVELPITEALEEEKSSFEWDDEHKDIVGKDKYLYGMVEEMEKVEKEYDSIDVESAILSNAGMKPTPKNPVASATLTGAVLGTAAGVTAGARTQARNDSAQQTYNSLQSTLSQTMALQQQRKQRLEGKLEKLRKDIAKINDFDIIELDGDERDKYMKQLKCRVNSVELSESKKNLRVRCVVEYSGTAGYEGRVIDESNDEDSKFFDTLFRVDGVIKLVAMYHGEAIGEGFVFGHAFGWAEPQGFHPWTIYHIKSDTHTRPHRAPQSVYIKLEDGISDTLDVRDVEIEFVPYHLWLFDNHSFEMLAQD